MAQYGGNANPTPSDAEDLGRLQGPVILSFFGHRQLRSITPFEDVRTQYVSTTSASHRRGEPRPGELRNAAEVQTLLEPRAVRGACLRSPRLRHQTCLSRCWLTERHPPPRRQTRKTEFMQLVLQRAWKSLRPVAMPPAQLPALSIITGANGSGKSNLLEALQQGAAVITELGALDQTTVRLFKIGELVTAAEGPVNAASYRDPWTQFFNQVQSWKQQYSLNPAAYGGSGSPEELSAWLRQQAVGSQLVSEAEFDKMVERADRSIDLMDVKDFARAAPIIMGFRDPFLASLSEIFLTYSSRRDREMYEAYRAQQLGIGDGVFDKKDFEARFGTEPWNLLDGILRIVGLPYRFESPPQELDNLNYQPLLVHDNGADTISPADLSSGEKVLLSIAMTLFTSENIGGIVRLPRLLLLDEPDASLHPSMVRSLLRVVQDVIVGQQGVPTIMTTHSPTTVALAPDNSLFVMRRDEIPRLVPADRQRAIKELTVGVPTLAIRVEDRRQVFVESEVDQACYQAVYQLMSSSLASPVTLEFVAVGKKDVGGGSTAILRLVPELRGAGALTVVGIVDRDDRTSAPEGVVFVQARYSIENLVLDPLALSYLLLRENIATSESLGLEPGLRTTTIREEHRQALINGVRRGISFDSASVVADYVDGSVLNVPVAYLETQGHAVESSLLEAFPGLKRFQSNLKLELINRVYADHPQVIPADFKRLFESLAAI